MNIKSLFTFTFFLMSPCLANTIYVDDTATGLNDGTSWINAYKFLQDAITSSICGDVIKVAQGIYFPDRTTSNPNGTGNRSATFSLKNGVILQGGYAGYGSVDPNVRDINVFMSILSGDLQGDDQSNFLNYGENSYHVVTGNGTNSTAIIDGFTISHGNAEMTSMSISGGGIYIYNGNPIIKNCKITYNRASYSGGGICDENSSPDISSCIIQDNEAHYSWPPYYGGGICNNNHSDPNIINCTLQRNTSYVGGGICNINNSNPNIKSSDISYNTAHMASGGAVGIGGGIYNRDNSSPHIDKCSINYNSSYNGGGIYNNFSSPIINSCSIRYNTAIEWSSGSGGGIYNDANCYPVINDCNISNNTSKYGGGGIYSETDCNFIVDHCTINNNTSDKGGGFGFDTHNSATIRNCQISGNITTNGGAIYTQGYDNLNINNCMIINNSSSSAGGAIYSSGYEIIKLTNCIIYNNSGTSLIVCLAYSYVYLLNCIVWGNTSSYVSTSNVNYCDFQGGHSGINNISVDPCFADPCHSDFHLQSTVGRWNSNLKTWVKDANTSPCIDAGDPNSDWTKELWPNGKRINMGAYGGTPEASMSLSTVGNIANLDNDPCDKVDLNDLALFASKWCEQANLLAEDLDRNGHVDFNDFAIFGNKYFEAQSGGPGISYNISPCEQGLSAVETYELMDSNSTRFTVTVNGHYIHFDDVMFANCCADSLWLEMKIIDNQVIIYEHEHETYFCLCICDYPVDADAGPFESCSYTLTVYEDYGGLIGSTTFTIN